MAVRATRLIRRVRGGSQAHLVQADDGAFYVVKVTNNPQHRRTLINEWLACACLRYLQVFVPETSLIEFTTDFLARSQEVYMLLGSRREPVLPGIHFGSRVAVNPERVAVFDMVPDSVLAKVRNKADFLAALVFDNWVSNLDSRQAVFFRARVNRLANLRDQSQVCIGFSAQMIDHGSSFNGPLWTFEDYPLQGLYFRRSVYDAVTSIDSFQPWLDLIENFPIAVIQSAWREIPQSWREGDEAALEEMLEKLMSRRRRVAALICQLHSTGMAFKNWRKQQLSLA